MRWIAHFILSAFLITTVTLAATLTATLLSAPAIAQTDDERTMRHAIMAYTEKDFSSAFAQMQAYLPLASADAAYYLGLMSIEAQGADYDPVSSLAYLQAASEWNHPDAEHMAQQIEPHLNAEELAQAEAQFAALQNQVEVLLDYERFAEKELPRPERTRARAPRYPRDYAARRMETWLTVMQVVSPEGKVITALPVENVPREFIREYNRVEGAWRYEEVEKPYPLSVRLLFEIETAKDDEYETINDIYEQTLSLAMAGVPEQQMYLTLLASTRGARLEHEGLLQASDNSRDWLERAARGGYRTAQRYLAIHSSSRVWGEYLVSQGDLTAMAFYGTKLYTFAADPELAAYGEELVREAAAAGNENAKAILAHF
ncbi:hypothetical protein CWE08_09565 [Aliidiomarina iranensis]|uniref:TonB C-terminal domain-containing protein n=1 Tax=Aliidiomarina iranensis TaxID=1434071 RepID=A0A432VTA9_9GAMM|nr:hypothetical protein [Aliidiomarina iranensis]RUO19668.1 hypothetical protein CWE08_09565 [Aliidiomarina iranensis]